MKSLILLLVLLPAMASAGTVVINGNNYTFTDHPRVFLDGPAGTITARVKDPDGAGAGVAPQATDANPAFVALKNMIRSCVGDAVPCSTVDELDTAIALMALDWYMDNSQTDSLAAAKYWLNNIETVHSQYQYACDVNTQYCGIGNWSDWPSLQIPQYALAYTLIRSELSAGERTTFAQKMLNDVTVGLEDTCTNQLQLEAGATASVASGSTAVTGTGLSGLTAGRMVYFRVGGSTGGGWAYISTVNSDTSLTLTTPPAGA